MRQKRQVHDLRQEESEMALEEKMLSSKTMAPKGQILPHKLSMSNRENINVTGVKDVLAFDVSEVLLETTYGMLSIRGKDLHVNRLTVEKGEVDVTGQIDSLTYSDVGAYKKQGESLLSRLFR